MSEAVHAHIQEMVDANQVILFMKGSRRFPQCGFSARVVQLLDDLVDEYETVNVLADPAMRSGIKTFSDWPTIPQLYIKGEFVGGCDIVTEMYQTGELQKTLGVEVVPVEPPALVISDVAADKLKAALANEPNALVRIEVNGQFQQNMGITEGVGAGDVTVEAAGLTFVFDRGSAKRANGLKIDFKEDMRGAGFVMDNPNAPPQVKTITAMQLKQMLDGPDAFKLLDVRTDQEREIAVIEGAVQLTDGMRDEVLALPKDTTLVFHCHHGGRSQAAAEFFLGEGFTDVYNVAGGINAWSQTVDSSVPRY